MNAKANFVVYCMAKHGDGRKPTDFDPAYIQACIMRALNSGRMNPEGVRLGAEMLGWGIG